MRTGLIAAQARTATGELCAHLPLAGRPVLAWQVDLLRRHGAERIICLCDSPSADVLRLQHTVEATGGSFHALQGFAALPALVRAEDELIVLRDGLVPDAALVASLLPSGPALPKCVLSLPADHPLAIRHPSAFERIDAAQHWAGLLVMRGAPVQHLADFPADADAMSVLLRLALQAGTPCQAMVGDEITDATWFLADSDEAVRKNEAALIAAAAPARDWWAPLSALAATIVRKAAARGVGQGAKVSALVAMAMLLAGIVATAMGSAAIGLVLAATGAFGAQTATGFAAMDARLQKVETPSSFSRPLHSAVDLLSALTAWFALAPWPAIDPLAVCGPLTIGLARLAETGGDRPLGTIASDRASVLLALALAAGLGHAATGFALLATVLMATVLLSPRKN
ncbi:MAG TPA: hypothetical protein VLA50_07115 [Erythrobacter sp.]|nr:hypothetical protein [Erythrobacter sp.]